MHTSSNGATASLRLLRGSTVIGNGATTDDRMGILLLRTDAENMSSSSINYLDSPSTTSAITYKMQIHLDGSGGSGGNIFGINHWPPNDNYRGTSSITAYEISG